MASRTVPEWVALDWGTSNLRGWAMRGGEVLAEARSEAGMAGLGQGDFAPALAALTGDWQMDAETPIIACGMVGARQGWQEAPYRPVPCPPLGGGLTRLAQSGLNLHIIPGLSQGSPADVMRGEETQIAGFLALNEAWDGVLCLPGTHSKWVQISAGEVVSFETYMTGELFALLSQHSVLRHSVPGDGWDEEAFLTGLDEALSKPEKLAARLFALRATDLLRPPPEGSLRARLSGLLIGAELAAARPYWLGTRIAILGAEGPARLYNLALERQGAPAMQTNADRMTRAGLTAAWRHWKGQS
ncbi:MAG: 2-dehydro-3-deoxygalactonokinase [Sulfitobacter sp.]|nr:2-dehydro-3-deoxygalactonokinase [Sulfitobacter sp.]